MLAPLPAGSTGIVTRFRHSAAGRWPRWSAAAALAAAGAVAGGVVALMLVFLAVLLVLDSLVGSPWASWPEADHRFRRLVRARRRSTAVRRLRGRPPERLEVLDDRTGWAAKARRRALGVQPIPVTSVTGTVENYKARRFDGSFRPDAAAAEQWKRLWIADAQGAGLPPIVVYRVGSSHIVRDGHHRVSVARDRGRATIDADVVELHRPRF